MTRHLCNRILLQQSRDWFASVPEEKVDMKVWATGINEEGDNNEHSCLSVGCWMGWNVVYKPFKEMGWFLDAFGGPAYKGVDDRVLRAEYAAAIFFEMGLELANSLMFSAYYFDKDTIQYCDTSGLPYPTVTKAMVLQRLDEIIADQELTYHRVLPYEAQEKN